MAEIILTKHQPLEQRVVAALILALDGLDEASQRAWRMFIGRARDAEPGEVFVINTWFARDGQFHKRHMAIENAVFQAQERLLTFKAFRDWLKVGAGHCDWVPGPRGRMRPVPRSISYTAIDDHAMRQFHLAALAFLRSPGAQKYLWPHLRAPKREEMLESVLAEFERDA